AAATAGLHLAAIVGLPFADRGALYNVAAIAAEGRVLALIPKTFIPNYGEFYERRWFTPAFSGIRRVQISGTAADIPFGTSVLIRDSENSGVALAAEICEDLWAPAPPSSGHALAGATIIANLSASDEIIGKADYRRSLISVQSGRLAAAYIYADCGAGESSTDLVFAGHHIIAENSVLLNQSELFSPVMISADIDTERLAQERKRTGTFAAGIPDSPEQRYEELYITFRKAEKPLFRYIDPLPFVPSGQEELERRCEEVITLQAEGLMQRLRHTKVRNAVIGISGGLDSTLALLVTVRAFDRLSLDRGGIQAITMPAFGTTDRTYRNAHDLMHSLGVTPREISIRDAVLRHFEDIGHDPAIHDAVYENAQARERTQILMDIANSCAGLVIGTGDLSELALGWATYNGDHISMYGVNASIPKTLVRHLAAHCLRDPSVWAKRGDPEQFVQTLQDILDTPVSPELLPPEEDSISQKTEEIIGPYELHDFFLYYTVRWGFGPKKILCLAEQAFSAGTSRAVPRSREEIIRWMKLFYRRFFSQQFKRSCLPDGPKVGSVTLSPRGDWRMPSDADSALWISELETLENPGDV
ncbi:MAG: NAD(+) synthase, partial [Spirochaetaceae bacterium]|nr:NAD(+) synthase [Spirochaetaceae bacterium]